jgi:uncharacterized protein YhbP (UPF0306 family)
MDQTIIDFLQKQTCATICCTDETGRPYCFSCYYACNPKLGLLYFKSSDDSYHSGLMAKNRILSGTILPDKLNKLMTRGVQWNGELTDHTDPLAENAFVNYHKKFPMALVMKGHIFTVRLDDIKMTDSKLGKVKKILWKRAQENVNSV